MELREGYKQTEMGLIPEDWSVDQIKNHCDIKTGGKNTQDRVKDGTYPFFVRSQTVERINSYTFDGEAVLTAGDGVGTGKVFHYINGKFDCHQRVYRMSNFSDKLDGYYFYLYFSNNFYGRISQMTAKSSVDSVRMEMIADMNIPLPPTKKEQVSIATTLSDVDALITQLEKLITKKRQIKQGAMQTLLNPFEGNGELKHDWSMTTYGQAFDFISTAAYSRADLGGGDCGYIHYGDIHTDWENHLDVQKVELPTISTEQAKPYAFAQEGDLVMADASEDYDGIGKSVEIIGLEGNKVISGLHTFLLRSKGDTFVNGFKGYIHQIPSVKQQLNKMATGLKVYGVSKNNLKNIFIPRPPKNDQEKITNILRDMDAEISELACKVKKMKELKQGMMQSLLTGQIRLVDPAPKNEQ